MKLRERIRKHKWKLAGAIGYGTFQLGNVFYEIENNGCSIEEFEKLFVRIIRGGES